MRGCVNVYEDGAIVTQLPNVIANKASTAVHADPAVNKNSLQLPYPVLMADA